MKSVLLRTFIVSVTLLGLSACGSSSSPAASAPATSDTAAAPSDTNTNTNTNTNSVTDTTGADETGGTVPVVTVVGTDDEVRARITEALIKSGSAGFTIDKDCLVAVVARLSAADVQSFRESFFSPKLSPQGDALGLELENCRTADSTTTAASTTSTP